MQNYSISMFVFFFIMPTDLTKRTTVKPCDLRHDGQKVQELLVFKTEAFPKNQAADHIRNGAA